ncbi:MAG: HprK-related kinase B [Desulfococcaceae bacterium]
MRRQDLIRRYRDAYPTPHSMGLAFGPCRIDVWTNDPRIVDELREYYGPFVREPGNGEIAVTVHEAPPPEFETEFTVKPPDAGKTKIKEEFLDLPDGRIVRKRLTGMVFVFGDGENAAVGPCRDNLNQVINFINNRHIQWALCRGCLLGHAAGVLWGGRGLALAGFSGAGKSTLALHIMNLGATFVSNDRLMVEPDGDGLHMHGVAKLPRINPGTVLNNPSLASVMTEEERAEFGALPTSELWALEHKYDADIETCFGPDRFRLDGPMHALAILNWKLGAGEMTVSQVSLAERPDLLPAFMKSTGLFFLPEGQCQMPEPTEAAYTDLLARCGVLEFYGGIDFEKAARICTRFLEDGAI